VRESLAQRLSGAGFDLAVNLDGWRVDAATVAIDYNLSRLRRSGAANARCCEIGDLGGPFSRVLLEAGRYTAAGQLKWDLVQTARRLAADGQALVAVRNRHELRSIAQIVGEVFAHVTSLRLKDGWLLEMQAPRGLDWTPPRPRITFPGSNGWPGGELRSWPGLFSCDELDPGTSLLIGSIAAIEGFNVLDVGCGYGPLAVAAAVAGGKVTYADVDCRALRVTAENLQALDYAGVGLLTEDLSEVPSASADVVLSNPPTHAGGDVLRTLFTGMRRTLRPGGYMRIVVRADLSYEKWLQPLGTVERLSDAGGYKILQVCAPSRARGGV
jgi:16S rRNA G1207 methylase RsmC